MLRTALMVVTAVFRPDDLYAAIDRAAGVDVGAAPVELLAPMTEEKQSLSGMNLQAALDDIGDADLFVTMANMFLLEWDNHLERLQEAVDRKDGNALRMNAHTLKSCLPNAFPPFSQFQWPDSSGCGQTLHPASQ